jgi:tRNA G18 (ribose-2'-O)-methylase SpoU
VYSPKIAEDLVPKLYRLAKAHGIPMTRVVDGILRKALDGAGHSGTVAKLDAARAKKVKNWLKALAIAKVLFEEEGYHTRFLEQIEAFLQEQLPALRGVSS